MIGKRVALSMLAIGVTSLMVTAASFALFTSTATNSNNTFASGTVQLDKVTPPMDLNVTNIAPGDSGTGGYKVQYTGSLEAWVGLSVSASGGLMTCDGANSMQYSISDGTNTYGPGTNQVVGKMNAGDFKTFTINWNLPLNAGNTCQAQSATITLQAHAVQARNNTNAGNTGPMSW